VSSDQRLTQDSLPDVFPVHRVTYPMLMARSPDSVAWSMMCCGQMQPSSHKVAQKTVEFGGPKVPHWDSIGLWIPWIGRYVNAFINAMWYVQVTYERVAGFMADDFHVGVESEWVGGKLAPHQVRR